MDAHLLRTAGFVEGTQLKKGVRRAAVNSFGYIAKSLGPQDVLSVLLTNLWVQEHQSRVCSTVAIAIVVETRGPFTSWYPCYPGLRSLTCASRVCSAVAIAIVVETCGPFTYIPAIPDCGA
jgi:splicing factor 3B subunit 1